MDSLQVREDEPLSDEDRGEEPSLETSLESTALQTTEQADSRSTEDSGWFGWTKDDFHGTFFGRYRFRGTGDLDDHDTHEHLHLDIGDARRHKVSFSFIGRLSQDYGDRDSPSPFFSIHDTYSSRLHGDILRARADVHRLGWIESIHIGRQELFALPEVPLFDGVFARTTEMGPWDWEVAAYGGIPAHLYESSNDGDSIFGVGIQTPTSSSTWFSLQFARVRDERTLSIEEANEFLVGEIRQRLTPRLSVSARGTTLEAETRDLRLRASYGDPESGWSILATAFTLIRTQRRLALEFDPYYDVLVEEHPYHQFDLVVSKDLDTMWNLSGGFSLRELKDDDDESTYNHEWRRVHLTPTLLGWPHEHTDLSLTAELWSAEDQTHQFVGFEAGQRVTERLRLSVGTEYALFKYNPIVSEEREDVKGLYARGHYDIDDDLRLNFRVGVEDDDLDTFKTFQVGLRWRF